MMAKTDDPQLYASGYERNRLDRYWTSPWLTEELRKQVFLPRPIWECAAGRGDMSRALGGLVYSSDIDTSEFDESIGPFHENSFLDEIEVPAMPSGERCKSIITNPPYSEPWRGIADDFIRHGLSFFDDGIEFMAMLMRSEFKSGKTRKDMFGECPHYKGELVLTTRPRWDYDDPDAPETASPRHNFSWFMWQKDWANNSLEGSYPIQLFSYMPKGFKS
jgi:hypothetical protein